MNALDFAVIGIVLVSGVFALMRGFVHEVLSVTAWVGAAFAALYGLPHARPLAQRYIEQAWLTDAVAAGAIFLVTLVLLSLVTHAIAKRVRDSALNSLDRSLGFVFGAVRGAVIVCLAYMVAAWLIEPGEEPDLLAEARTRPLMETGARMIEAAIPAEYGRFEDDARRTAGDARKLRDANEVLKDYIPRPASAPSAQPAAPRYDRDQQRELDRLIQNNQ